MIVEAVPDADELRDHWWWRPGWDVGTRYLAWHLTFEGQEDLHRAVTAYQRALNVVPALEPVPLPWLHLTMAGLGHRREIPEESLPDVITAAHERLLGRSRMPIDFGRVVVFAESVVLEPDPADAVLDLQRSLTRSVREALGARAPESGAAFVPHVSLAYASGPQRGATVVEALEGVTMDPIRGVEATLSLVELQRDRRRYEWRTIHAFPL